MTIIITSVLFSIAILFLITVLKSDNKKIKEQEESLKDERLYDPLTGRHLTLDEAENETLVQDNPELRVKSDEEIEDNYKDDDKEIEYILRKAILMEFEENEDERVLELLKNSDIFFDTAGFDLRNLWRISNDVFIGLCYVSSVYNNGRSDQNVYGYEIVGISQGDFILQKLKSMPSIKIQTTEQTTLFRLTKKAKHQDFLKLVDILNINAI
jgi:hypothetical protein